MRQFLIDGLLLFMLVIIGTTLNERDLLKYQVEHNIQNQITNFEQNIVDKEDLSYNNDENKFSKLAKKTSSLVVDSIEVSIKTFSNLIRNVIE